jgi:AsmA protein
LKTGQFNFSDLTDTGAKPVDESSGSRESSAGNPISLLVSQVLVQDGELIFFDHVLNDKAPYRYEISALQIAAKGVSLAGEVPLSVHCQLNGSPFSMDGHINLSPLGGDFQIELQNLDIVPFKPYFQDSLPGKLGGLKLGIKAKVSGTPAEIALKGTLALDGLDLALDAMPETSLKNTRLTADYDLLVDPSRQRLDLRQLGLDYNGIKVNTKGVVSAVNNKPVLELVLTVPKLQLSKALDALPQEMIGDVRALDPTGSIAAEASLAGQVKDLAGLLKTATIDLEDIQVTAGAQRPAFSGRLRLNGDRVASEALQLRLGDNKADIALNAQRIFSRPVIVRADITSERFLLEPLLLGSAGSAVATDQSRNTTKNISTTDEIGPFDLPLNATGTIKVAETIWKGLAIKDFLTQYELRDNVLSLTRVDGKVAGGAFSNTARVDLGRKGLTYSANIGLKAIQADPLLTAFVPKAAGTLLGAMDLVLVVDGHGTQWQTLSRNLSGKGNMLVADGRLISPELVKGFSTFVQLPELNDIQFSNFSGQFKIVDGKVTIDSQMLSDALKLFPKGTVGLDGSLNLGLDTRLSPELSKKIDRKGGVMGYLADSEGWSRLPLLLKGTFASPSFGLDPKGVQEQATKALSGELGRQIDKLFKKPEPAAPAAGQQQPGAEPQSTEDPARKLLEDSLHKLFGN